MCRRACPHKPTQTHTNPHKAKAGHRHGNLPARAGPTHGDGKHPVGFEYVGQHPSVAGLKDVQWKDRIGKQRGAAQNHQRDFARN
ncbi:hypothetical protein OAA59_02385 [bacterium]|nr:hypothetical protein [bacterium]